jgi:hypothetical protein
VQKLATGARWSLGEQAVFAEPRWKLPSQIFQLCNLPLEMYGTANQTEELRSDLVYELS